MNNTIRFTAIFMLVAVAQLTAQVNLNVTSISAVNYPNISVKFTATDATGVHYRTYSPGDFSIVEDGVNRPVLSVSCPEPVTPPVSITLTVDISNSMLVLDRIGNAKLAAAAFVDLLEFPPANMGITVFDDTSYIWEPYSTNKARILQRIGELQTFGSNTDIHGAFVDNITGAIDFTKNQSGARYIIFFTDDYQKLQQQAQSDIINGAKANNIKIFTVLLDPYNTSAALKNIALSTGGQYFEKVTSAQQANDILAAIGRGIYQYPDCELIYRTTGCEPTRSTSITLTKNGRSDTEYRTFVIPAASITTLESTPSIVDFGEVPVGITKTMDVVLRAANCTVNVHSIQQNPLGYKVTSYGGAPPPFTLINGATRKLTIEYRSTGTERISTELLITCDAPCQEHISISSGYTTDNRLVLEYPNGGEDFYVGDVLPFRYSGISAGDEVEIDYSINGAKEWNTVASSVYNFLRNWIVADTPSDSCVALMFTKAKRDNPKDSAWLPLQPTYYTSLDLGAVNSILAAGLSDGRVKLYYPFNATLCRIVQAHGGSVNKVVFSPDGKWFATSGGDRRVKVWNSSDGTPVFSSAPFGNSTYGIAFSEDGQYFAGSDYTDVSLWRTSDWQQLWTSPNQATSGGSVVIDPKHRWVASAYGNSIVILNFTDGSRMRSLDNHTGSVHALAVSEDGWLLASGSADNSVRIWNTYVWEPTFALQGHTGAVKDISLSPGGMQVASASDDHTVRIWDTKKGTQLYMFTGHTAGVNGVAMGKRFGMVASGGADKKLRVWTFSPSMADRSDSTWTIIPKVTDITATTPVFETLLCPTDYSEKTVTIINRGNQTITISNLHIAGDDSSHFTIVSGPTIPPEYELLPEDTLELTIRYQADVRGLYNALLEVITTNSPFPIVTVQLSGRKEEAVFSIDPPSIDLGELYHCTVPVRRTAVITNTGTVTIALNMTGNSMPNALRLLSLMPDTLEPGESDTILVELNTLDPGTFSGTMTFTSMPCAYTQNLTIAYSFINSAPLVNPSPLVFDYTSVGNTSYKDLTITNPAKVPMNISIAAISGGVFALSNPSVIPLNIPANGSVPITLQFTPAVEGPVSGQLMIVSDAPCTDTVYVPLQGSSAKKPSISGTIDPFARLVCAGEQYAEVQAVVRNTGGEDLVISDYFIAGTNPGDFVIVSPLAKPVTIPQNGSQPFAIGFKPTQPGNRTAELLFVSNAENEDTLRIALNARKDSVNFLITTAPLVLGELYHCSFPLTRGIQFTNPGNVPVTINLDPASMPAYASFQTGTFPIVIQPGGMASVSFTIQQPLYGTYNGTLRFTEQTCNTVRTYDFSFSNADSKPVPSALVMDFGLLNSGTNLQRSITLANNTASPVGIASLILTESNAFVSRLQPATLPLVIAAGGSINLEYQYAPANADTLDLDVIIITDSPCIDTIIVHLTGRSSSASALVSLPTVSAKIGSTIRIPLTLEQSSNLAVAGATSFTADISFNASMLWITGVESGVGSVQYSVRIQAPSTALHIDVTASSPPPNGILAELVCVAALGNAEQTALAIDSFYWDGTNVAVATRNGLFTAEGICRAGGDRLVGMDEGIVLFQNAPNPFNPVTEIGYVLPETMSVELRVFSSLGKEMKMLVEEVQEKGYHTVRFDGSNYPSGLYVAVLRGGNGDIRTIQMIMTK